MTEISCILARSQKGRITCRWHDIRRRTCHLHVILPFWDLRGSNRYCSIHHTGTLRRLPRSGRSDRLSSGYFMTACGVTVVQDIVMNDGRIIKFCVYGAHGLVSLRFHRNSSALPKNVWMRTMDHSASWLSSQSLLS